MHILLFINFLFLLSPVNVPQFSNLTPSAFYLGTEGYIYVKLNNCNPEDINVKISAGYINRRNDSTFTFFPQAEGEELKLKLYYKKVICEVKSVTTKKVPDIIPFFDVENENRIKKSDLDKLGILKQVFPTDFPEDMKSDIYSFHLIIMNEKGATIYGSTMRGNTFDEGALNTIKKLNTGSKLLINNILVQNKYRGVSRSNAQKEIIITE